MTTQSRDKLELFASSALPATEPRNTRPQMGAEPVPECFGSGAPGRRLETKAVSARVAVKCRARTGSRESWCCASMRRLVVVVASAAMLLLSLCWSPTTTTTTATMATTATTTTAASMMLLLVSAQSVSHAAAQYTNRQQPSDELASGAGLASSPSGSVPSASSASKMRDGVAEQTGKSRMEVIVCVPFEPN